MSNDEELARYMTLIEQYKEEMGHLENQAQILQSAILDYNKAKISLENLKNGSKNEEVLFPIGGNVFINAKTTDNNKVLAGIGAGFVKEKTTDEAIEKLDKKIDELQKTEQRIFDMIQNIQNEAAIASEKAQKLYAESYKQ